MSSKITLLSPAEAAERLGVSVRRVQQYCQQGRLGQHVGTRYVIRADELRRFRPNPTGIPLEKS